MNPPKFGKQFQALLEVAVRLFDGAEADAILISVEAALDWDKLKGIIGKRLLLIAADSPEALAGIEAYDIPHVLLATEDAPVHDRLTQTLLEFTADDLLRAGARVVAVYSGFEVEKIDTVSLIRLHEHLGRLTSRDLRQFESQVPLDTLKAVVDLAVEIGREGREGKPVGTMFIVGDTARVLRQTREAGFDPVKGYDAARRSLKDPRNRESIKEVAQLDGAFLVTADGLVRAACRIVKTDPKGISISHGLGSRHWAGAAISKTTRAIAVVVSESNGTVRIFRNGEQALRIEPFRRAMKWKEFDFEPPASE